MKIGTGVNEATEEPDMKINSENCISQGEEGRTWENIPSSPEQEYGSRYSSGSNPDISKLQITDSHTSKEEALEDVNSVTQSQPKRMKEDTLPDKQENEMGIGHQKLYSWLNKNMKIEMTDGRILIGVFLCTDRDGNVILGSCSEYINPEVCGFSDEPRVLGLVMVPGRHIVSIHHDAGTPHSIDEEQTKRSRNRKKLSTSA